MTHPIDERVHSYLRRRCTKDGHSTTDIARALDTGIDGIRRSLERLEAAGKAKRLGMAGRNLSWMVGDAP